jgi:hypothetical protein
MAERGFIVGPADLVEQTFNDILRGALAELVG